MRILVTNDDGIEAPGLHVLGAAVAAAGHDTVVAAPTDDMSGASASIWRMHHDAHLDVAPVTLDLAPRIPAWSVDASPGLIVLTATLDAFGPEPDVVLSGINAGLNTGESILHSGTVGAVLTAQRLGLYAMAISLEPGSPWTWSIAADMALDQLPRLLEAPPATALNLNVPHSRSKPSLRHARLNPHGTVRTAAIAPQPDPRLQLEVRTRGLSPPADSDAALLAAGYATLTSITGVHEQVQPPAPSEQPRPRTERSLRHAPAAEHEARVGAPERATPLPHR